MWEGLWWENKGRGVVNNSDRKKKVQSDEILVDMGLERARNN